MTPTQKHIALLEFVGWVEIKLRKVWSTDAGGLVDRLTGYNTNSPRRIHTGYWTICPDADHNLLAQVRERLTEEQKMAECHLLIKELKLGHKFSGLTDFVDLLKTISACKNARLELQTDVTLKAVGRWSDDLKEGGEVQ